MSLQIASSILLFSSSLLYQGEPEYETFIAKILAYEKHILV